jgi:hypothetical protein
MVNTSILHYQLGGWLLALSTLIGLVVLTCIGIALIVGALYGLSALLLVILFHVSSVQLLVMFIAGYVAYKKFATRKEYAR